MTINGSISLCTNPLLEIFLDRFLRKDNSRLRLKVELKPKVITFFH